MKCQGLYLGSPCKDSWFEVDRWVIKIMNALGVAVPLALGENQWRCSNDYMCEGGVPMGRSLWVMGQSQIGMRESP
jgi:hypothetical protein